MSLLGRAERCFANQETFKALNAFVFPADNGLLQQQQIRDLQEAEERSTQDTAKSPVDGRLIAIKDNICTTEQPTTCASAMLRGFKSPFPATVVEKLKAAGAVIAGKTNMDEFGMGSHSTNSIWGAVMQMNAINGDILSAGGSSGGSAIAVATGQCDATPALRIGVPQEYNIQELQPVVREAWLETLRKLQEKGHSIHALSLPATKMALSAYYILAPAEASSNLAKYDGVRYGNATDGRKDTNNVLFAATRGVGLGAEVKRRILLGSYSLSAAAIDNYFIKAQKVRRLVQEDFNNVFSLPHPLLRPTKSVKSADPTTQVDVILTPTAQSLPPKLASIENHLESYSADVLTVPASLAGLPAISVPVRSSNSTVSVGLQVLAQYGDDDLALDFAKIVQDLE
ncbi:hypothetical protein P7C71_g4180, partial [Lecanoromycetidae sp. Uapishka_2]